MTKQLKIVGLSFITLLILSTALFAQSGGGVDLTWNVLGSGGTNDSSGGSTGLSGTLGQTGPGPSSGGTTQLNAGFWQSGSGAPLAVTLGYFHAVRADGIVHVNWQTVTEAGVAGFRLYGEANGTRTLLTEELVPSTVIDAVTPTSYSLHVTGDAHRFLLEEVGVDRSATLHGPFDEGVEYGEYLPPANVELEPAIYLPVVTGE